MLIISCDKLNFVCPRSFHFTPSLCHTTFKFTSVRRPQSPPPARFGQLWCQSAGRRRRRWEKQGEHFTQFSPSVPFSVRSGQRDPGPGQREQAHPIQVSRAEGRRRRRRERCKAALNKVRKRKRGKKKRKKRWGYNLRLWRKKRGEEWNRKCLGSGEGGGGGGGREADKRSLKLGFGDLMF